MTALTPSDVAQMVADACHECLSSIDDVIGVENDGANVTLTLVDGGNVYTAVGTFSVSPPTAANEP